MKFLPGLLLTFLIPNSISLSAPLEQGEFFEKNIRPVLIQHCYECHNSSGTKKGGLALDYKAALLAGGDSGAAIVAGKPQESLLIQALRHQNGYEMPAKAPKLNESIIKDFEEWIKQGAIDPRLTKPTPEELRQKLPWEEVREARREWWAFQPVQKSSVPKVSAREWAKTPLDAFLYDRMMREGLKPEPEAAPEVLVRRLHLILTGLPPQPEVVSAFVKNPTETAYTTLVDKLLNSSQFGERWARHWMDWYRYAESHGSEGDPAIPYAKEYRDYLIRALNADVPYDQLLREHLAGDLLQNPRINQELGINESAIGPAHLRMVPHGFGVTDAYGEQITFTDNQIDVISKAMLGITISCARCHNHKFDPISQKDFYRFYGVMIGSRPSTVLIDSPAKLETNKAELTALKKELRKEFAAHWLTEIDNLPTRLDEKTEQLKKFTSVTHPLGVWTILKDAKPAEYESKIAGFLTEIQKLKQARAQAISEANYYLDLRDPANAKNWFTTGNGTTATVSPAGSFAVESGGNQALMGIYPAGIYSHLISDKHAAVFSSGNFVAQGKQTMARVIGNAAQLRVPVRNYPLSQGLLHGATTLNNLSTFSWQVARRKWTYWAGENVHYELRTAGDILPGPGNTSRSWFGVSEIFAGDQPPQPVGASLVSLMADPKSIQNRTTLLEAYTDTLKHAISHWREGRMSDAEAEFLDTFVQQGLLTNTLSELPESLQKKLAKYRQLESEIPVPKRAPGVIDAEPVDQPLLVRGEQKQEAEPVKREFLEVFNNGHKDQQTANYGRLELAADIVGPENTLKSRVLINRLWVYVFGRGLVASTDNFGRLGTEPTHPELLDYLVEDFEDKGWSIKRTLKKLVTSRTFKSSSAASAATLEQDAENRYLSHFTPRRLDAETIYDSLAWIEGKNQRAVYLPVIRNRLNPFLETFNAPVPTSTVSQRTNTNVPAQSLAMMNGEQAMRAARAWANRIQRDASLATPLEKIQAMFLQAYARQPSDHEIELLLEYLSEKPNVENQLQTLRAKQRLAEQELKEAKVVRDQFLAPVRERLQQEVDQRNMAAAKARKTEKPIDLKPIAVWDFESGADDSMGNLHGTLKGNAKIVDGALLLQGGCLMTSPIKKNLNAKTLEILVQLDNFGQRGGGAMTVQTLNGSTFDSIVYAEAIPGKWLAGSNFFKRTVPLNGEVEKTAMEHPVRMIFVYEADGTIHTYRNGKPYAEKYRKAALQSFAAGEAQVVFGLRHGTAPGGNRMLTGKIHEARLYDRALTPAEVTAASSGVIKEMVTRKLLLAALTSDQQQQLSVQESAITKLEQAAADLSQQLKVLQDQASIQSNGYYGIAHALLNSREFLYVY